MQQLQFMLIALVPVLGTIVVGFIVRRLGWLTEVADKTLLALTVRLLMPCFVIRAVTTGDWFHSSGDLFLPPIVGAGLTLLGFVVCGAIAFAFAKPLGLRTAGQRGTFILCAGMFNYGYTPIPLVRALYPGDGDAALATLLLHNMGIEIVLWTIGLMLLAGSLQRRWWVGVLNPIVLAILFSVTLKLIVPAIIGTSLTGQAIGVAKPLAALIGLLADASIPLSLLLTGATIADVWRQADFRHGWPATAAGCMLRLGVLPTLFLLVALLPLGVPLRRVVLVQAAMPAAIFPLVLARHYGGDAPIAVRVILATQILSILTTPFWLWLGGAAA